MADNGDGKRMTNFRFGNERLKSPSAFASSQVDFKFRTMHRSICLAYRPSCLPAFLPSCSGHTRGVAASYMVWGAFSAVTPTALSPLNDPPTYITAITPATATMSHLQFFKHDQERHEELADGDIPLCCAAMPVAMPVIGIVLLSLYHTLLSKHPIRP